MKHFFHTSLVSRSLFLSALALAPACSSDVDTPTNEDYDQVAQGVAPLVTQDLSANSNLGVALELSKGQVPWWLTLNAEGVFEGNALGITWSVSIACQNAAGEALLICDASTDSAEFRARLDGTLVIGTYSAELSFNTEWTLQNGQSDEVAITASTTIDAATDFMGIFRPVRTSLDLAFDAEYDVIVPKADSLAVRGTASAALDVHRVVEGTAADRDARFVMDLAAAFDGSGTGQLTFDGNASYELNLASGQLIRITAGQ